MVTWIIRAVDWGNIQRSPTFQAIFNYYFSESNKLPFSIIFDGAGTRVDEIMWNFTPVTKKLDIIYAGMYYDILKGENKSLADDFWSNWHGKDETLISNKEKLGITKLYSKIKTEVHLKQMQFRNEALLEVGIPKQYLPGMRVPFRHNHNLKLILPLEKSIAQEIEEYYHLFTEKQPTTEIYGNLVGINSLKDELTGGIETARKQVEYFLNTREKAIEEIIRLFPTNLYR